MQAALESALAELALGPEIRADDARGIDAWLARHDFSEADACALRRDFPRLLVYRRLVRNTLSEALRATIPRAIARLGTSFERYFDEFLRVTPPATRYLRDLTPQFLRFTQELWPRDPGIPPYLGDLARHEALQVELASLFSPSKAYAPGELSLDEGVEFIDAARLVQYAWCVHRLPDDESSAELPPLGPASLLVYRSREHEVRYLELTPFAHALLSSLLWERRSLRDSLSVTAERLGSPLDDELLTRAAKLLADLAERGALLGKTSSGHAEPAKVLPNRSNLA